jgi:acyl-CoA reductase-like NAD-dependent aldehyde dehydrogenase
MSVLASETADRAVANDSVYGPARAARPDAIKTAQKITEPVRVGTMGINDSFGGDITVPFGGSQHGSNERDTSRHAFDDYTELKTTWIEFD